MSERKKVTSNDENLDVKGEAKEVDSPWLKLYPDLGNLTAWTHDEV